MARVFLSFLGTGEYQPVRYRLGERESQPEAFVQAALLDLLEDREVQVLVLHTEAAARKHGRALRARLPRDSVFTTIKEGTTEAELWEIFSQITEAVPKGSELVFDCTHGFRSLSLTGAMATTWLRAAKGVRLGRVLYGAYEARAGDVAPVFDLTAMFELPAWAEAVSEWRRTARPAGLVERSKPYLDNLRRQLKQDSPKELTALPEALELLGGVLRTVRSDKFSEQASRVSSLIDGARAQLNAHPSLAPLGATLDDLKSSLAGLMAHGADPREPNPEYLRHQVRVARWYIDHRDVVEAYSVLRECITSATVRCVRLAGVGDLEDREGHPQPWHKAKFRASAEYLFECVECGEEPAQNKAEYAVLAEWSRGRGSLLVRYREAERAVRDTRNKLNHCWTGDDHAREGAGKGFLEEQVQRAMQAADKVEQFVNELVASA